MFMMEYIHALVTVFEPSGTLLASGFGLIIIFSQGISVASSKWLSIALGCVWKSYILKFIQILYSNVFLLIS